jgi:hypothetical protein
MTPCIDGGRANEAEPQPKDVSGLTALASRSLRGPGFCSPWEIASDDVASTLGSFNIMGLGDGELGLLGYPRASLLTARCRQVAGGVELTCSWVATVGRLLKEMLDMVGRDVLQPAQVSS